MSGIDVTITLDSADLEAALDRAIAGSADLRSPMSEIADEWMALVRQRFDEERDPLGVPWAKRKDEGDGHKLLQKSRHLFQAVRHEFGTDFAQVGVEGTAGPKIYARIHNEGGTIKHPGGTAYETPTGRRANFIKNAQASSDHARTAAHDIVMPKREFVGFGPGEQAAADEILVEFLRDLFAGDAA